MPLPVHLFNADLEKAVLGRLLKDPEIAALAHDASPEIFSVGRHRVVFSAIQSLQENGDPVTISTVGAELYRRGVLDEIGGIADGLMPLVEFSAGATDFEFCVNRLTELSIHRRSLTDLYRAIEKLEAQGSTLNDLHEVVEIARRAETLSGSGAPRLRTVQEVVQEYPGGLNAFLRPFAGDHYMRFPWERGQRAIGGIWPGEVLIVGGRPGHGKSAAALQLARYNAQFGLNPAIYNLEMSDQQTIYRTICARAGVPMSRFRMGECSDDELRAINRELVVLHREGILLCDRPTMTIQQIRKSLRRAVTQQGVRMAIIDYLQLAESGIKADNRTQEVSYISRQVKLMAMEFKIPLIVLAQLSRKSEDSNREPTLSDLRESGSIEQDADVVMFTYRKTEVVGSQPTDRYSLLFPKVRSGEIGRCRVHFDTRTLEFRDMEMDGYAA